MLVTGDIANSGDPAEHARADELLGPLTMPVLKLAGNHDLLGARLQYVAEAGGFRIVVCDTSQPGLTTGRSTSSGSLRNSCRTSQPLLRMYYLLLVTGMAWVDDIGRPVVRCRRTRDPAQAPAPQVKLVVGIH